MAHTMTLFRGAQKKKENIFMLFAKWNPCRVLIRHFSLITSAVCSQKMASFEMEHYVIYHLQLYFTFFFFVYMLFSSPAI